MKKNLFVVMALLVACQPCFVGLRLYCPAAAYSSSGCQLQRKP